MARTSLWQERIADLIQDCQLVGARVPAAQEAVAKAVSYYTHNEKRMDHADLREEWHLIGSGAIESACKQIVSLRLKRSGARWTEPGAEQTAKAELPG